MRKNHQIKHVLWTRDVVSGISTWESIALDHNNKNSPVSKESHTMDILKATKILQVVVYCLKITYKVLAYFSF
jgi:hypothetical protein